jgi:TatD DNase family protein
VSSNRSGKRDAPPAPEPLAPLIDAHTHLDACGARDAAGVRAIVDRAAAVGVGAVVTIADDLDSARWVTRAAGWDPRVYAAVALHPTRANALNDAARAEIERLVALPRVVAVGETGMDLYWPGRLQGCAEPHVQREAFAWHIDLAKRCGKPLMIHNREADAAVLDVLAAEGAPRGRNLSLLFVGRRDGPPLRRRRVVAEPVGERELPQRPRPAGGRAADTAGATFGGNRCTVFDAASLPGRS